MAGEVLDWPASPETIDFPFIFLDFPCFSIGSARGPEMWEPIGGQPNIFVGPQNKYLSAIRVNEGFFRFGLIVYKTNHSKEARNLTRVESSSNIFKFF